MALASSQINIRGGTYLVVKKLYINKYDFRNWSKQLELHGPMTECNDVCRVPDTRGMAIIKGTFIEKIDAPVLRDLEIEDLFRGTVKYFGGNLSIYAQERAYLNIGNRYIRASICPQGDVVDIYASARLEVVPALKNNVLDIFGGLFIFAKDIIVIH